MTVELTSRRDITLEAVRRVAWQGEGVRLTEAALSCMTEGRAAFLALLDGDPDITIYGVTSGYGQMAKIRLTPEQRAKHAAKPSYGSATSYGEAAPERLVRAITLARLANFLEGHAAVSPRIAEAVAAMLNGGLLPRVPLLGNGGAGEILPLGHLFSPIGETIELGPKDSLSLVNGSPCSAALIADAALAAANRIDLALKVFALAAEAFQSPLGHYSSALDGLWGDEHETWALSGMRRLLEGAHPERRPYQAPVGYRILPRILGQARRALAEAERAASVSLASVTDNPVFIAPDDDHPLGHVLSNGGYQNAQAYPALDGLAACWADLALLAERQGTKMLDPHVSLLPEQLLMGDGYMGCMAMTQVGIGEAARQAASRTFLPASEAGGFGQNDVASPTFFAWIKQRDAGAALDASLAILAATASQALAATERPATPPLAGFLDEVREAFPLVIESRVLGPDIDRMAADFTARVYPEAA